MKLGRLTLGEFNPIQPHTGVVFHIAEYGGEMFWMSACDLVNPRLQASGSFSVFMTLGLAR
jgi:hypothetical protein